MLLRALSEGASCNTEPLGFTEFGTNDAANFDRAARSLCIRHSSDPQLLESAVTLSRRAVDLGKDHRFVEWYQMALGMAEYRRGNYPAADQELRAAEETDQGDPLVQGTARLYHAMSLFRQGREAQARQLFAEAVAQMKPLPADERQPLANGASADDVIVCLAYKEAKALCRRFGCLSSSALERGCGILKPK